MTLKEIIKNFWEYRKTVSSLPSYAVPKPRLSDKNDTELQQAIYKFCNWQREAFGIPVNAAIIDVKGTYRADLGRYTYSGTTKGVPDLWLTFAGESICLEVKVGKDSLRKEQKIFMERQREAQGEYYVIKSWADFWVIWDDLILDYQLGIFQSKAKKRL